MRRSVCVAALLVAIAAPRAARAFTIQAPGMYGCHEQITGDAFRDVRATIDAAAAVPTADRDDLALMDDVAFELPDDLHDIVAATLLIGARENDLEGRKPTDLSHLAELHGASSDQDAHCLRSTSEDDPDGSTEAIEDCRAFIDDTLNAAFAGLGDDGLPDVDKRESKDVYLEFRGVTLVRLPTFWFELGRALHTVEDSYPHTYRTDDYTIETVLNFVDMPAKDYSEAVDGPQHITKMDECLGDAYRMDRMAEATSSATAMLMAVLDPEAKDDATRLANAHAVLDSVLAYEPGCDASNGWCSATERQYLPSGCSTSGRTAGLGAMFVAFGALVRGRRRMVLGCALASSPALAKEPVSEKVEQTAEKVADATKPTGIELKLGMSVARLGLAPAIAIRYRLSETWVVGADAEWNPWFATSPVEYQPGSANLYLTLKREFPMKSDAVRITSSINLGASMLLFDLYGAPAGSIGPYFGMSILGVEWKAFKNAYLMLNPGLAIPIPNVIGTPFAYHQYRLTVGIRWGA